MNKDVADRAANSAASLSGFRVLLVEDAWIVAQSYAALLEPLGVQVVGPAASLTDASRLIEAEGDGISAALVDINLQGEMADPLVEVLARRKVPVIIVSGHDIQPALVTKAVAVLKKPIRAEHLLRTLRSIAAKVQDGGGS